MAPLLALAGGAISAVGGAAGAVAGAAQAAAPIITVAGTGLQAYSSYRAGEVAKGQYEDASAEEIRQSAFEQKMGVEQAKDIMLAGEEAKGRTRAAAGGKGLRVAGSVKGQINTISEKVRRRQQLVNLRVSEQMRRSYMTSKRYLKAGRRAMKAGRYSAYAGLLTGGAAIGGQLSKAGWFNSGKSYSGTAHIGGYRPSSGYGLK